MDSAINKSTGKIVSAFSIFKDGSYQNLDKGEWIAPSDSITNWDELKEKGLDISNYQEPVHYVSEKEYTNFKGTQIWCDPYFAIYPGSIAKTTEESQEHKKSW